MFLAKTVTFVVAIGIVISLSMAVGSRTKRVDKGHIEITHLNETYEEMRDILRDALLGPEEFKQQEKLEKKRLKEEKAEKKRAAKLKAAAAKEAPAADNAAAPSDQAAVPDADEKKR